METGSAYSLYEGQVYRPPSEANSLILQVTTGCSYNGCIYCSMFKNKKFRIKTPGEIRHALKVFRAAYGTVERIFLADGDALAVGFTGLVEILEEIASHFPECKRISAYGSSRNVLAYSEQQLEILRKNRLALVYMGVESGSDAVLQLVKKSHTRAMCLTAAQKLKAAGIMVSASIICGLGGKELADDHAKATAGLVSQMDPAYLGILRLTIDPGTALERRVSEGRFVPQTPEGIIREMQQLITGLELSHCVIRSNHVCNLIAIAGTISEGQEGKEELLAQLRILGDR